MDMTNFVSMAPGARTYVAHLSVKPDFSSINNGTAGKSLTREDRKSLAWTAVRDAENAAVATAGPKLDALKAAGLVTSYEFLPGTSSMIINVPETKAGAAWDAIRGVDELGRVVRNREVKLEDTASLGKVVAAPKAGTTEYNVSKLNVENVWKQGFNGQGVTVGLVDTGANTTHEALRDHYRGTQADGSQVHSYNFFDGVNGKTEAYDDHSHGSHVAGTSVGGTTDHAIGMAPGAKFISAKVFTAGGSGSTATILRGLSWMLAPTDSAGQNADPTKAPDIVSNSWGNSNGASLNYLDAWKAFEAAGIIPVVAAGNAGPRAGSIGAPGSYPQSITIGATDSADNVARFSSRGPNPIKDANGVPLRKPDVTAPGVDIISAGKTGDQYVKMSGTSMATPGAAGVIALLLSKYPNLSAEQVRGVLAASSVDLGTPGYDNDYGYGRIDAAKALAEADKLAR
jgi:subtilisin family serine protease